MASELSWEQWPGFTQAAARALEDHQWPGNVRELRNVIERAVYRWDNWDEPVGHIVFDPFDSPWKPVAALAADSGRAPGVPSPAAAPSPASLDAVTDLKGAVDAHEKAIVEQALARHRYNQRQTAKALGLSYDQLRHAMKKHGLGERP
jgi:psp operon transcriptional activator